MNVWMALAAGLPILGCSETAEEPTGLFARKTIVHEAMMRMDADGDGALSVSEVDLTLPAPLNAGLIDKDQDQLISASELVTNLHSMPPRMLRDLTSKKSEKNKPDRVHPPTMQEIEERVQLFAGGESAPKDVSATSNASPNILLISVDTLRQDFSSPETMPNMARIASMGTSFSQSFANGNESIYSHATIFTGLYPSQVARPSYEEYAIPDEALLLPEILQSYGYKTAAFTAGGHLDPAFGHDQGYETYSAERGFASFWNTTPKALQWLDEPNSDKPWFLFLHGYDAHDPYTTLSPFFHLYGQDRQSQIIEQVVSRPGLIHRMHGTAVADSPESFFEHPGGHKVLSTQTYRDAKKRILQEGGARERLTEQDVQHLKDHYQSCAAYADLQIGLFLSALEARGQLEHTIIVLVSDHGEDLLDHGYVNHRTGLWDSVVHVPLIVVGPGFPANTVNDTMVEQRDILPTILGLVGATVPANVEGRDLRDASPSLENVFIEGVMDMVAVRNASHKLIYSGTSLADPNHTGQMAVAEPAHFELFDLAADAGENTNLLENPTAEVLTLFSELRLELVTWRESLSQGTHWLSQDAIDPAVTDQMQRHGYWKAKAKTGLVPQEQE